MSGLRNLLQTCYSAFELPQLATQLPGSPNAWGAVYLLSGREERQDTMTLATRLRPSSEWATATCYSASDHFRVARMGAAYLLSGREARQDTTLARSASAAIYLESRCTGNETHEGGSIRLCCRLLTAYSP